MANFWQIFCFFLIFLLSCQADRLQPRGSNTSEQVPSKAEALTEDYIKELGLEPPFKLNENQTDLKIIRMNNDGGKTAPLSDQSSTILTSSGEDSLQEQIDQINSQQEQSTGGLFSWVKDAWSKVRRYFSPWEDDLAANPQDQSETARNTTESANQDEDKPEQNGKNGFFYIQSASFVAILYIGGMVLTILSFVGSLSVMFSTMFQRLNQTTSFQSLTQKMPFYISLTDFMFAVNNLIFLCFVVPHVGDYKNSPIGSDQQISIEMGNIPGFPSNTACSAIGLAMHFIVGLQWALYSSIALVIYRHITKMNVGSSTRWSLSNNLSQRRKQLIMETFWLIFGIIIAIIPILLSLIVSPTFGVFGREKYWCQVDLTNDASVIYLWTMFLGGVITLFVLTLCYSSVIYTLLKSKKALIMFQAQASPKAEYITNHQNPKNDLCIDCSNNSSGVSETSEAHTRESSHSSRRSVLTLNSIENAPRKVHPQPKKPLPHQSMNQTNLVLIKLILSELSFIIQYVPALILAFMLLLDEGYDDVPDSAWLTAAWCASGGGLLNSAIFWIGKGCKIHQDKRIKRYIAGENTNSSIE